MIYKKVYKYTYTTSNIQRIAENKQFFSENIQIIEPLPNFKLQFN